MQHSHGITMDEVPVSPVQRKRKKFRRKLSCTLGRTSKTPGDLSNTDESFQQSVHCSSIQTPVQDDNGERKQPSFYFDDCSENIETVTANPLASAILLEKASVVAIPSKVPSEDFIFNSNQDFITVGELAKRTGADRCIESAPGEASQNVVSNPVSYNFTQFEVDTQLLGIFDAAAQLSACGIAKPSFESKNGRKIDHFLSEENASHRHEITALPVDRSTIIPMLEINDRRNTTNAPVERISISCALSEKVSSDAVKQETKAQTRDLMFKQDHTFDVCSTKENVQHILAEQEVKICSENAAVPNDLSLPGADKKHEILSTSILKEEFNEALVDICDRATSKEKLPKELNDACISNKTSNEPSNDPDSNSSCDRTLVQAILDDFRLEDAETCSMEMDFSIIKTEGLRRRLIQMQHLINSPPKTVKRQKDCRQYGNVKRNPKQSIARRLSYDTDSNSSVVGQPASDDETTSPTEGIGNNESDDETSMDCVALNTSVYIQANLTQLSAFFSQSPTALNDSSEEKKGNEVNSQSIDQEMSFHGFASPISLASEVEHSPKTERMYFYTFDESDGENRCHSSDDETSPPMAEPVVMEHLLEDDEDLLMLAQHVEEKARDSLRKPVETVQKKSSNDGLIHPSTKNVKMHRPCSTALGSSVNTSGMSRSIAVAEQFEIMPEKKVEFSNLHPFIGGFSTVRGKSIAVSEKALARAQNMLAEEEEKIRAGNDIIPIPKNDPSVNRELRTNETISKTLDNSAYNLTSLAGEENTFGNFIVGKDQPFTGGFSTARGSSIAISAKALAKAKQMLSEEEAKLEKESGMISNSHLMEGTRCTYNAVTPSVRKDAWIENKRNDGTETSFSGNKSITVDAPITAQKPFDEEETKENISNIVPINTVSNNKLVAGREKLDKDRAIILKDKTNDHYPNQFAIAQESELHCKDLQGIVNQITRSTAIEEGFEIMPEKKVEVSNLHPFTGGFSTARGKSIAVSAKALERAQNMLAEEEEKIRTKNEVVSIPINDNSLNRELRRNATTFKKLDNSACNLTSIVGEENTSAISKHSISAQFGSFIVGKDQPFTGGFSTARGSSIAISAKALEKAKQILSEEEAKFEKENDRFLKGDGSRTEVSFSGHKYVKVDAPITITNHKPNFSSCSTMENVCSTVEVVENQKISIVEENGLHHKDLHDFIKQTDNVPLFSGACVQPSNAIAPEVLEERKHFWNDQTDLTDRSTKECETLRKRKISFSQDELVVTPTKKLRTHLQLSEMALQSSTPSAVKVEIKEEVSSDVTTSKPATTCAVEEFFAQLDDHEFQELFSDHRPQNVTEVGKKQNKLLEKFEQCSDAPPIKPAFKSSDFDDSFSEISTNVSMAEAQHPHVPDEVQIKRIQELEKQSQLIESKPEEACRPRVCDFTCRKQQKNRKDLQKTLGGKPPKLAETSSSSMGITQTNVMQFRFHMADYYGESFCQTNTSGISIGLDGVDGCLIMDRNSTVGVEEMKIGFLASPGVDPRLVPPGWVENAWRWIVIKLSAYERNCREHLSGSLTPENVLAQLHHRYHVEIDAARRPAMRKILEKDDVPSRRMVLFVSNIYHGNGPIGTELELSDGWYSLRTVIDVPLASAVRSGKIFIGMKLMVQGAELLNHNDACGPLEVPPDVRLKITANSSRRARWYAKLGYCRHPMPVPFACNSILAEGGLIVLFRAIVIRSYPMLYLESFADKAQKSIMRSERLQLRYSRKSDASQLEKLHKLYNQVQHDIEKERAAEGMSRNMRVTTSTTSEELQEYLENGLDLSFVDIDLTPTQQHVIERFQQQRQQELEHEINRRVKALLEKDAIRPKVSSLLKVRLVDSVQPERSYLLSIWRPSEEVCSVLQEEAFIEFGNVAATGMKTDDAIQLTANGDNCTYKRLTRGPESVPSQVPFARTITSIDAIDPASFRPAFGEFDTIGAVVQIVTNESATGQSVYLADTAMNLLCVRFNPNLAGFAYDDVVQEQVVLYVTNLQWRTRSCHTLGVPHCFATYFTTCVVKPVHGRARSEWDRFQVQLEAIDREDFFRRCQEKVGDLPNTSGVSSAGNITPNASGSGTPFRQQTLVVGLQHSTPIGTGVSAMKRKINRLASMYGSPPKLSPIAVRRNPVLTKGFKTPGRLEDQT